MYVVFNTLNPLIVYLLTEDINEAATWLHNNGNFTAAIAYRKD